MRRWLIKRLLLAIPVVFGVVTISFMLMHLAPGDPARLYLGDKASAVSVAALRHTWGLDKSIPAQYAHYLAQLATGDLGQSTYFRTDITSLILERLPVTLGLMVFGAVFAVLISVPLASRSAARPNGVFDGVTRVFNAVIQGSPTFFVATILILFLGLKLAIFPAGGYPADFLGRIWALILPGLAIALSIVPLLVRSLKTAMIEARTSEYVAFATSKGLPQAVVARRYVLHNAGISGVSILGIQIGALASGALIVEQVFAIPGLGSMLINGILNRDYLVVEGCTLVFGIIVVLVYLITDFVYARLDPRARLA